MNKSVRYRYVKQKNPRRRMLRLFSFFLVGGGITLLLYVVFPIVSWQFFYAPILSSGNILSPVPKAITLRPDSIGAVFADATSRLPLGGTNLTYASNWFPTGNPKSGVVKEYLFSIPKLGITHAKVIVGSDDLAKSLIHYGGSSLPGEYGNAVVFGHSVLPQFFNPANYKTIFSTLHTLKIGDTIELIADGVTYKYTIFDFKVVEPEDISVLEQAYDNSYLTVITCTPPGTYWKRLVVKAKVEKV